MLGRIFAGREDDARYIGRGNSISIDGSPAFTASPTPPSTVCEDTSRGTNVT